MTPTIAGVPTGGPAKDAASPPSHQEPPTVTAVVPGLLQSPTIGRLVSALSVAHGLMKAPGKGRNATIEGKEGKRGYSYNYADLADVIECYRAPLSANGLTVTQPIVLRDTTLMLLTILAHESGEWMASEYPITAYAKPQEQGSAITYARRYAVSSLLGIAAEDDDDGKRAQDAAPQQAQPVSADAAAIIHLAAELEQITGMDRSTLIKEASFFQKEGKDHFFTDPTQERSGRWLNITRGKLEKQLQRVGATSEPGAAEAAGLFTDTRPA